MELLAVQAAVASPVPYQMNGWYLAVNIILILLLVPGGFFMFKRYLKKMKQQEDKSSK